MEEPRHELAALIDRVRDANGWSDTDIANRAKAAGHKLGKSNLSRIRNSDVVSITASAIRGLAAGLGVPEPEVARAALASMGIHLPHVGEIDLDTAVKLDPDLSVRDKTMVLDLLKNMREPGLTVLSNSISTLRTHPPMSPDEFESVVRQASEGMIVQRLHRSPDTEQPPYNPESEQMAAWEHDETDAENRDGHQS